MEMPVNWRIMNIARGKSLFPFDFIVPIKMTALPGSATIPAELLRAFRIYIDYVMDLNITIPDDVADVCKTDFVAARQSDTNNQVTAETMSRWLTLAKLVTASCLRTQMSVEDWRAARAIERERAVRVWSENKAVNK